MCSNPDHLSTNSDPSVRPFYKEKLTPQMIEKIKIRMLNGDFRKDVARDFGVSGMTVWRVINGKNKKRVH